MLNIVKSLLYRLKKNKMFWIMLGVCAFLPVLTLLLNNLILEFADIFVDVPLDMGLEMTTYMTLSELVSLSSNANFFTLLCVSIFLCKEFTDGTIRNALLSNKSRINLYTGYGLTALIIGGSYLVTYFVSTLLALAIPFGFGDVTPNQAVTSCLCSLMMGVLSLLFATGKQAPSIVLPLLVTMFLPGLMTSVVELVSTLIELAKFGGAEITTEIDYTWVPLYNAMLYDSAEVDGALVGKISLYYILFTALFVFLGGLTAVKKDLK